MENKIKVLIAEDENLIALDLKMSLQKIGYEVLGTARDYKGVVEKASTLKPDLILMDIGLEGEKSGLDASREIQKHMDVPIVYLTGQSDEVTIGKAKTTDPFGYIIKPLPDVQTLKVAIELAIYKHKLSMALKIKKIEIEKQREKSEELLKNILPEVVIRELKDKGEFLPKEYENVSIMYTDFQDFTSIASKLTHEELVTEINDIFLEFDEIITEFKLEKIKTIGDSYFVASGVPDISENNAERLIDAAFAMQTYLNRRNEKSVIKWEMRTGINTGSVIAGIIGKHKFVFDIWGETVEIAAILEQYCIPGRVNVSKNTLFEVSDKYKSIFNQTIYLDKQREINCYFLEKIS